MPTIKIHNITNGEIIEREMTDQELVEFEASNAKAKIEADERAKLAAKKAELLNKLGITAEEAKLLF